MLKICTSLVLLLSAMTGTAQPKVAEWRAEVNSSGDYVDIQLIAELNKDWKIYSQFTEEGGPLPSSFEFELPESVALVGDVKESENFRTEYSDLFEINVSSAKDEAVFTQRLSHGPEEEEIVIRIKYMCCDGLRCIPPTTEIIRLKI